MKSGLEIDKALFERKYRITKCCVNCVRFNADKCTLDDLPVEPDGVCKEYSRDWETSRSRGVFHWLEE